jgi:hypothetical protein
MYVHDAAHVTDTCQKVSAAAHDNQRSHRASSTRLAWAFSQGLGLLMMATEMHCQEYDMVDQSHEHGPRKVKASI